MHKSLTLARRAHLASALSFATLLGVGIWSPSQAQVMLAPNMSMAGDADRDNRNMYMVNDTLSGTVERVLSANSFDLRANDGYVYRVNLPVSVGLVTRTNVRVTGALNGSMFDARTILINYDGANSYNYPPNADNYNSYQRQNVILHGRVVRFSNRSDIDVRDEDDGHVYRVITDRPLSNSIGEGARVEARGYLDGNTIRVDSANGVAEPAVNNGYMDKPTTGIPVTFSGPLLDVDLYRQTARVRAGNGSTYTLLVPRSALAEFRVGQRVRVQGNWLNERVEVTRIMLD